MIKRLLWRIYTILYNALNSKNVIVHRTCRIDNKTTFEGCSRIYPHVDIRGSKVGYGTYIANSSQLSNVSIGRYCSIAQDITIISGLHPTNGFISTHPAFFSTRQQAGFTYVNENTFEELKYCGSGFNIEIGNDVWIGAHVKIMQGVRIGDGAIIGAMSLVTKDVEPYGIYVGIPAKKIKSRFEREEIDALLDIKWWNKGQDWIEDNVTSFHSIKDFVNQNIYKKAEL